MKKLRLILAVVVLKAARQFYVAGNKINKLGGWIGGA